MGIDQVIKRDGRRVPFDRKRIENAIYAAARAVGNGESRQWAETLSWAVTGILEERFGREERPPHVEEIQDIVEEVLIKSGHPQIAKAYILYRQKRAEARAAEQMLLDTTKLVDDYLDQTDWRVSENSNMNYSLQGLNFYLASSIAARYWLHKIYPPEVQKAHIEGDLHIHDLGMLSSYCAGWDLQDLLIRGFGGVPAKIESRPPRHLRTALGQLVNFFYTLQGEVAGAVAVSNFDTLLAPFIRYDRLDEAGVRQAVQEFVYNINVPTRVGFQTPFTNLTMDLTPPSTLRDQPVIIGGKPQEATYGEFQPEMDLLNRAFAEIMLEGDARGRVFSVDYASYVLVREKGEVRLVPIGEYIDGKMATASPSRIEHNQAEVLDVGDLGIETIGIQEGKVGWQRVRYLVRHPADQVLKITTVGGFNVSVTPAHSVLVLRNGEIVACEAGHLEPGDYLLSPRTLQLGQENVSEISLAPALAKINPTGIYLHGARYKDGQPLYEVRTAQGHTQYNYKVAVIPLDHVVDILDKLDLASSQIGLSGSNTLIPNTIRVDESLLEFLGYYVAEGSAEKGKCGGISLGFNLTKERDLAVRIAGWLCGTFSRALVREVPGRNLVEVRAHSKLLRRIILDVFGIAGGIERQVPALVFGLPDDLKRAFLRGYFNGDASCKGNGLFASTIAPKVAYGISTLLKQLGIAHTWTEYVRDNGRKVYRVNLWDKELAGREHRTIGRIPIVASGLETVLKAILEREPVYRDAKNRRYRNSLRRIKARYGIATQKTISVEGARRIIGDAEQMGIVVSPALKSLVEADLIFLRVRSIQKQPTTTGMVYDFSTDSESFLANQILVHNTFPIPTYNITRDFNWENPALEPIWDMTARYGIPYWGNYINSDMRPEDARSMCPLHPDTEVIVRGRRQGQLHVRTIHDVYHTAREGVQYEVLFNGRWLPGRVVSVPTEGCREFTLSNGTRVALDLRHEQPVKRGRGRPIELLTAAEIREGMYLPFNATPLGDQQDNYDAGFAVGAFLGDGSYDEGALNYALNNEGKEARVARRLHNFFTRNGFAVSQDPQQGQVVLLRVGGSGNVAEAWMAQFVAGRNASQKALTARAFQMGHNFLRGILDGWYATDGGNRGCIYTISEHLCRDFAILCGLLGLGYRVDLQGDARAGRYEGKAFTLKFHNRTSYGRHFFYEDGFWWYPVVSIRPLDHDGLVYCFAVDSEEHLFQLANGLITHNCRLRLDNRELRRRLGGLFAAAPLTGSVGVVTINLPRLAYLAEDEADFHLRLERLMEIARTSLEIKRKMLENLTERGLYPYSRHYLEAVKRQTGAYWSNHFSTIGLLGMNEACLNLLGVGIAHPEGKALAVRTLNFMRQVISRFQEETGNLYNLEATPAEGASYRLARADRKRYPNIRTAGTPETPYYTNSTHLPVSYSDDLFEVLEHQDELQTLYTGGTVLHIFLGERLHHGKQARRLVRLITENYRLPYFTITPTFSICPVHGYIPGEHFYCPYEHTAEELARYGV